MKNPYKFAKKTAQMLFEMHIETSSSLYDSFEHIPSNFVEKLVDSPMHSAVMKLEIQADILFAIAIEPDRFWNSDGEYEYQSWMYDYVYAVDSYVEKMWKMVINEKDRVNARKMRESIDYRI